MSIDENNLLYSLAKSFCDMLSVQVSDETEKYMKKYSKKFAKIELAERIYYSKYSLKLATDLSTYLPNINLFEINTDADSEILHDFRLGWGRKSTSYISINHKSIKINNIIPEKLMKICGYPKNTKMYKAYTKDYNLLNKIAIKKISSKEKYSEVSEKTKSEKIIDPMIELFYNTLSKRKKCADKLFNHLFDETNRIVLKLYKNRHVIYDFGKDIDDVESYKMKIVENEIVITFNNGAIFNLRLAVNSVQIREKLSLKFHTIFTNMDEFFSI